jgi:hypothetical protein
MEELKKEVESMKSKLNLAGFISSMIGKRKH